MDLEALRRKLDGGLSSRPRVTLDPGDLISAAVLLPITDHGGPHVLFTKKSDAVPHHKGQFSFPGGVCEAARRLPRGDGAPRGVGGDPAAVPERSRSLGLLDDTATRATPFIITPVVGIVREPVGSRRTAAKSSASSRCR